MKFGTTWTSRTDFGSNKKSASRKLGSSFQNAQLTSRKILRRLISAACANVGALESGFTVEPCATIRRAVLSVIQQNNVQRPTLNVQRSISARCCWWEGTEIRSPKRAVERILQNLFFSWTYQNRPLIVASDSS